MRLRAISTGSGVSLGAIWAPDQDRTGRLRLEYRTEYGDGVTRDRDTWAVTAGYSTRIARDWRLLADLDAIWSDSGEDPLENAEYLHASLGYAYRPITNERLNVLFRASVIHDLPARDQRGADGTTDGPQQRSAILSLAGTHDLMPELTTSAKLGYRMSEIADRGSTVLPVGHRDADGAALRLARHAILGPDGGGTFPLHRGERYARHGRGAGHLPAR